MEQDRGGASDPIKETAQRIAADAADIEQAEVREAEVASEIARLNDEKAALQSRLDALEQERGALHTREVRDERDIAREEAILAEELGDNQPPVCPHPSKTFIFFVDSAEYATDQARMTGRQIKAKVADWDPSHDLTLEGVGNEPDRVIRDDDVVDFAAAAAPLHFSSTPKANFGSA